MAEWPGNQSTAPILPSFAGPVNSLTQYGAIRSFNPHLTHYLFLDNDGNYKVIRTLDNQLVANSADFATAFNQYSSALPQHPNEGSGFVLQIAPGKYVSNSPLYIASDYHVLYGAYPGAVRIQAGANFNNGQSFFNLLNIGAGLTPLIVLRNLIRGIVLDGNISNNVGITFNGLSISGNNCTIEDCNAENFTGDGFYANAAIAGTMFDLSMINCYGINNQGKQFNFDTLCSDYDIVNCRADGGSNAGIAFADGFSFANGAGRFRGCHAYFCGGYGLRNRSSGNKITEIIGGEYETNGTGIFYNASSGVGVRIIGAALYGNTTTDIELQNVSHCAIIGCSVTSTTVKGLEINACTACTISDCQIDGPATGIVLENGSTACQVHGNTILGTSHDITVDSSSGNFIYGNTSRLNSATAIREINTGNNNKFFYNNLVGGATAKIATVGAGTIVHHNDGFVTENGGTATIPNGGTSVVVNHGLVAAPNFIDVTPLGDPAGRIYVDTITATQFTIHSTTAVGANTNINWRGQVYASV